MEENFVWLSVLESLANGQLVILDCVCGGVASQDREDGTKDTVTSWKQAQVGNERKVGL